MSRPIDVLFTQRLLMVSGFDPKGLDGHWGKNTQAASDAFDAEYYKIRASFGEADPRSEGNIHSLIPRMQLAVRKLLVIAKSTPFTVKIISGTRTYAEQDVIFAQGRSTPGNIVTNARGGESNHNLGIAIDVGIWDGTDYFDGSDPDPAKAAREERSYVDLAAKVKPQLKNLDWGGDWKRPDRPHYELHTGKTVAEVRRMLEMGKPYV